MMNRKRSRKIKDEKMKYLVTTILRVSTNILGLGLPCQPSSDFGGKREPSNFFANITV